MSWVDFCFVVPQAGLYPLRLTYNRLLQGCEYLPCDVDNSNLTVCAYRARRFFVKNVIS